MPISEVKVTIDGSPYTLRGDAGEAHLQKVAQMVNSRLFVINKAYPRYGGTKAAVLAALQLADDFLRLREAHAQLQKEVDEMTQT
ncbi:MAG: cell division protein ZapA [Clostridiales bacterium]|nr:cell division protein ZapA [Clostridiales bacterium]